MVKLLASVALVTVLSGCAALEVASFQEHPESKVRKGQQVTLDLIHPPQLGGTRPSDRPGDNVDKLCFQKPGKQHLFVAPAAVPLITAGAAILVNEAAAGIKAYVQKAKEEFTRKYRALINLEALEFGTANAPRCLRVKRLVGEEGQKQVALDLLIEIQTYDTKAISLRPRYLALNSASAVTGKSEGTVDLDVTVAIVAALPNRHGVMQTHPVAEQTLKFAAVPIGSVTEAGSSAEKNAKFKLSGIQSTITALSATGWPAPASILVVVQETGSGADAFGKLGEAVDRNKDAVKEALDGFLEEKLKKDD